MSPQEFREQIDRLAMEFPSTYKPGVIELMERRVMELPGGWFKGIVDRYIGNRKKLLIEQLAEEISKREKFNRRTEAPSKNGCGYCDEDAPGLITVTPKGLKFSSVTVFRCSCSAAEKYRVHHKLWDNTWAKIYERKAL